MSADPPSPATSASCRGRPPAGPVAGPARGSHRVGPVAGRRTRGGLGHRGQGGAGRSTGAWPAGWPRPMTVALVSGTNGKTTTTTLLARGLAAVGPTATNAQGANLASGLAGALLASPDATYRRAGGRRGGAALGAARAAARRRGPAQPVARPAGPPARGAGHRRAVAPALATDAAPRWWWPTPTIRWWPGPSTGSTARGGPSGVGGRRAGLAARLVGLPLVRGRPGLHRRRLALPRLWPVQARRCDYSLAGGSVRGRSSTATASTTRWACPAGTVGPGQRGHGLRGDRSAWDCPPSGATQRWGEIHSIEGRYQHVTPPRGRAGAAPGQEPGRLGRPARPGGGRVGTTGAGAQRPGPGRARPVVDLGRALRAAAGPPGLLPG